MAEQDNFETNPISLAPTPQQDQGIVLPKEDIPRLPQPVVDARADKATLGLSSLMGKSKDEISSAIGMNEPAFRKQAAAAADLDRSKIKQEKLGNILRSGQQVDPKALADFMVPESPTDPRSVIEEKYSQEFMSPIMDMSNAFIRETAMNKALQEVPKQARELFNAGADLAARGEYARKLYQDMAELYRKQGWLQWGAQTVTGMVPGIREMSLEDKPSFLLGANLEEQRKGVYNLPFDQFKDTLDKDFELFKQNPSRGLEFFDAMVGQSSKDEVMNNFGSIMDATAIVGGIKTIRGKFPPNVAAKVEAIAEILDPIKEQVKATADVKEAPVVELSPEEYAWENEGGALGKRDVTVVQPDASGDIKEAGIRQSAQNTLREINQTSDPTAKTVQNLPTVYKKDQRGVRQNPGNYGQEIVNRLDEEVTAHIERVTKAVKDTARVNKVNELMASEDVQRKLYDEIKDKYPELSGNVINLTGPHWDKATNSWHVHMILGRNTGTYHATFSQAKNWARANDVPLATTEEVFTEKTFRQVGKKTVPGPTRILKDPDEVYQPGATIEKKGFGFYVKLPVSVDLRSNVIRDALGKTDLAKKPIDIADNWLDAFLGWIRNPDDTSSMQDRISRKIANSAPEVYFQNAREAARDIAAIAPASQRTMTRAQANKRWDEWQRMVESTKSLRDPATGEMGYDFKGPGEVENWYLSHVNRMPEQDELAAYFAFKRIHADDYMYRSMSLAGDKINAGAMEHRFQVTGPDGKQVWSPWFEGVRLTEHPRGGRNNTVARFKRDIDHTQLYTSIKEDKEAIEEVKTGKSAAIEIYDPDKTPLAGFGPITDENQVRYVVARNHQTRPISITRQLPRRGGPHMEYDYPHYLKEPDIVIDPTSKTPRYRGDKTVYALVNRAQGEELAKGLNEVKKLGGAGDFAGAQAKYESMFETGQLTVPWQEFLDQHTATKNDKGKVTKKARLDWNSDFMVVPRDKTIADMPQHLKALRDKYPEVTDAKGEVVQPAFEDGSRSGSIARQNQIQFTGQRDAYELKEVQDVGKRHNPIFKHMPAKSIDSMPMQNRALARIMNDYGGMAAYKAQAIEHWLFGDADGKGNGAAMYIDTGTGNDIAAIRQSPFYYFNNYKFHKGIDPEIWSILHQSNFNARQFAGTRNWVDTWADATAQKLADVVYGKMGPVLTKERSVFGRKFTIDPIWMIPHLTDGPRFLRAIAFNTTMGFHTAMFPVHLSTYLNVAGIAGLRPAAGGAFGALLHSFTAFNRSPEIMKFIDGLAAKGAFPGGYNFKPGQWMEAFQGMMDHGANYIEPARMADLDNPTSANILQSGMKAFLNFGLIPFRAGLKPVKLGSWYAAYLERRNGGGGKFGWEPYTGRLTDKDWAEIHERADILSHNMTRASTSLVQKGLAANPMQFQGYHLRVLELLFGKRLTWTEKARFVGTLLTTYGVRGTAGVVGLAGIATQIAQDKDNYVPGHDMTSTLIMEGLLATGVGVATGKGDIQAGKIYNFGSRYGVGDFEALNTFLDGDSTMWNLWGAAPNKLGNVIAATGPFRQWGISFLRGEDKFQLTTEHWVQLLKEVFTGANDLDKMYWGIVANRWVNKNRRTISSDVSAADAVFMATMGLQQERFNTFPLGQQIKHMKEMEQKAFDLAVKEATAGFRDRDNGDYDAADIHYKNARAYLEGYPEHKWHEVVAQVRRSAGDLVDTLEKERFRGKNVPRDSKQQFLDTYEKIRELSQKRGQQ